MTSGGCVRKKEKIMNNIIEEINRLKKEKNAVILAHFYVAPEIQDIADYVGDSFYLSRVANDVDADVIVFCGVYFMGESAKVLNPDKTVLMPEPGADCPMAHMVSRERIEEVRKQYDDLCVVCYINSTAEIKRYADVCVTSANAVKIVKQVPEKNIFFIPDRNLAHYIAKQVPEKNFIFNEGYCPTHERILAEEVAAAKKAHPEAQVLAHPECTEDVLEMADYIGSTSGIISYAGESDCREFIILTEEGVISRLRSRYPEKSFYFTDTVPVCPDMKKNSLEGILRVLETGQAPVSVSDDLRTGSKKPLERMLELAK